MQTVNIHAAKAQLSRLVDEAAAGQEIVITRAGRPVAKLVPLEASLPHKSKRVLGALVGRLQVPADFDAPLSDGKLADFEKR